jgi:hypothetical protein
MCVGQAMPNFLTMHRALLLEFEKSFLAISGAE